MAGWNGDGAAGLGQGLDDALGTLPADHNAALAIEVINRASHTGQHLPAVGLTGATRWQADVELPAPAFAISPQGMTGDMFHQACHRVCLGGYQAEARGAAGEVRVLVVAADLDWLGRQVLALEQYITVDDHQALEQFGSLTARPQQARSTIAMADRDYW
ncbi:hypothetical protein D9M68_833510 [compost metagenome]